MIFLLLNDLQKLTGLLVLPVGHSVPPLKCPWFNWLFTCHGVSIQEWLGGVLVCCSCFHMWMWSSQQLVEPEPGHRAPSDPWSLLGGFLSRHVQSLKMLLRPHGYATQACCFPSALGKAAVLPAGLTAVLCLVNMCTSLCKPSPMLWSLPGSYRKHLIATISWVANNTKQKVWGAADHHQMTFWSHSHGCVLG